MLDILNAQKGNNWLPYIRCFVFVLFVVFAQSALAQKNEISFTVGPQISTLGIGLTGGVHFQESFSISADINILPLENRLEEIDDITYDLDPNIGGFVLMANYHPQGTGFSIGVGTMLGGYKLQGVSTESNGFISVGDNRYASAAIGTLTGDFEVGGPSLAVHVGWRKEGFNFGLGIFTYNKSASLDASGPIRTDPTFRANVDEEIDNILDELDVLPVIPYLRIGYQFGL